MVHVKEVEKVENLIKTNPVPSNILFTRSILCDHRANDGKDGKQNEDRYGKFERTEEVKEDGDPPFSLLWTALFNVLCNLRKGNPLHS